MVSRRFVPASAPAIPPRRHRLFAGSQREYSTRGIELARSTAVIDMLFPLSGSILWSG